MAWPEDLGNPEWCSMGSRLTLWLCREWPHCARSAGAKKDEPYEVRSWVRRPQSHLGEKRRDAPTFPTTTNFLQLRASACVSQILHEKSRCINQNIMARGRPETTRPWYWIPQSKELEVLSPGKPDELEDFEDACCLVTERSV